LADDLLECECLQEQVRKYNLDEDSKVSSEPSDDDEDLPDLKDLGAKKDTDVGNDSGSVSDEEEEPAFVAASQYEGKPVSLTWIFLRVHAGTLTNSMFSSRRSKQLK
jgi:hypothetical protein